MLAGIGLMIAVLFQAPSAATPSLPTWPLSEVGRTTCREHSALAQRLAFSPSGQVLRGSSQQGWLEAAQACPGRPEIVIAAVRAQLGQSEALPAAPQKAAIDSFLQQQHARFLGVQEMLVRARSEAQRLNLGDATIRASLSYWTALAAVGSGDLKLATQELGALTPLSRYLPSTCYRLEAVLAMAKGDANAATELAFTAAMASDRNERVMTDYLLAMALDRVGDHSGAAALLARNAVLDPGRQVSRLIQTWLPARDQLYLEAMTLTASGQDSLRALAWWSVLAQHPAFSSTDRIRARAHTIALAR